MKGTGSTQGANHSKYPPSSVGFDWTMIALSGWLLVGLYVDGWAHRHISELETFFTPWHGVLYSGMLATLVFLAVSALRGRRRGYPWRYSLPAGYDLSFLGVVLFGFGGFADLTWHLLFGIEHGVDALLSPTHLFLALSGLLIGTGPLRSVWRRATPASQWAAFIPALLSLAYVLSLFTFFTQFAHPLIEPLATQRRLPPARSEVFVMAADGSAQTRLIATPGQDNLSPSWTSDGRRLFFASKREGVGAVYEASVGGGGKDPTDVVTGLDHGGFPAVSPDGSKIAFISGGSIPLKVYVMDAGGGTPRQVTSARVVMGRIAWSPDGMRIAYTADEGGIPQVHIIGADGGGDRRLLPEGLPSTGPSWSPDGTRVAFAGERGGNWDIYMVQADGSGLVRLTNDPAVESSPAWSPDGTRTAFVSQRGGNAEVWAMNANGSGQMDLTVTPGLDESSPAWSPDGERIAYTVVSRYGRIVSFSQALGIASIVLQTAMLMGFVLLAMRRWTLPFGAVTVLLTVNAGLMTVLEYQRWLFVSFMVAGVLADILLRVARPSAGRRAALYLFSFAVPAVLFSAYFLLLQVTQGIGWPVHLWAGSIVLAGVTGVLLGYLLAPPPAPARGPETSDGLS